MKFNEKCHIIEIRLYFGEDLFPKLEINLLVLLMIFRAEMSKIEYFNTDKVIKFLFIC